MFTQLEDNRILPSRLLFLWVSAVAAGAVIVVWQSTKYLDVLPFHYIGWFHLVSFLDFAATAGIFAYISTKENRLRQAVQAFLLTPVFVIVFLLSATFMSEMVYGGSGYHGEYAFPFLRRMQF